MTTKDLRDVSEILDATYGDDDRPEPKPVYHLPKDIDVEKLPPAFRRVRSAYGFLSAWKKLRLAVWSKSVPYPKLPAFAARWGERLFDTHERYAYDALLDGDIMFFDAWSKRMLIIDAAAEAAGLSFAERGTILYAHGVLKGYMDAAAKRFVDLGGSLKPATAARPPSGSRRAAP